MMEFLFGVSGRHPELLQQIRSKGVLDEALETKLHNAMGEFKKQAPEAEAAVK